MPLGKLLNALNLPFLPSLLPSLPSFLPSFLPSLLPSFLPPSLPLSLSFFLSQISPIDHLFVLIILFLDFHDTAVSLLSVSSLNTLEQDSKRDFGSNSNLPFLSSEMGITAMPTSQGWSEL